MTDEHGRSLEEALAERRRSAIEAGRRKGGAAGAALAGAMIAVSDIVEGPRRDDAPVTVEASGEPDDVDRDGVAVDVDGVSVVAPPLERRAPVSAERSVRSRRRRDGTRRGG